MKNSRYSTGISLFSTPFPEKGQTSPISGCGKFSSGDGKCIQIDTGKHGIQPIRIFHQSAIHRFLVAELTLDDSECVLYFATHRGFAVFDVTFPVNRIVADLGETTGAAIDSKTNLRKMLVVHNFRTLSDTEIKRHFNQRFLRLFMDQRPQKLISNEFFSGIITYLSSMILHTASFNATA